MDVCLCGEGFICAANSTYVPRTPCTCAPEYLCPACRAAGEQPYRGSHVFTTWQRGGTVEIDPDAVAYHLRAWLKAKGLSSRKAAPMLGISPGAVRNFLRGAVRFPRIQTAETFRTVAGIPAHCLDLTPPIQEGVELPLEDLPAAVVTYRKTRHLTYRQLAWQVGCSAATIKNLETRRYTPRPSILQRLSAVLGMTIGPKAA